MLDKFVPEYFKRLVLPLLIVLHFPETLQAIERMPETTFDEIMDKYVEMKIRANEHHVTRSQMVECIRIYATLLILLWKVTIAALAFGLI